MRKGQKAPGPVGFACEHNKSNINKGGRPKKGETLTDYVQRYVEQRVEAVGPDGKLSRKMRFTLLCEKLYELGMSGDLPAIKYLMDRVLGKPTETVHEFIRNLPDVVEIDLSDDNTDSGDEAAVEK